METTVLASLLRMRIIPAMPKVKPVILIPYRSLLRSNEPANQNYCLEC